MEIAGEHKIAAPPEAVWAALNDAESLRRCLPGCEMLERTGANEFTSAVRATVGPVAGLFKGKVKLADLDPPHACRLAGRAQGGSAGFVKGSASLHLTPEGEGTRVSYEATADVGGRLATVGERVLESVARQMAREFFARLDRVISGQMTEAEVAEKSAAAARTAAASRLPAADRLAWFIVGAAAGVAITLYLLQT